MNVGDGIPKPNSDIGCILLVVLIILGVQLCGSPTVECKCECPTPQEVSP